MADTSQTSSAQSSQPQQSSVKSNLTLQLPSEKTLMQATKLSIKLTKPIDFYFFLDSVKGDVRIINVDGEKIIFKNENEHTSPILNTYKSDNSYIVVTENTIYMLNSNTKLK